MGFQCGFCMARYTLSLAFSFIIHFVASHCLVLPGTVMNNCALQVRNASFGPQLNDNHAEQASVPLAELEPDWAHNGHS